MWGRLFGNDFSSEATQNPEDESTYRYVRNLHFRNDIKELSVGLVFDLKKNQRTFISRPDLVPYLTAGIAVFHHNPKAMVPDADYVHFAGGRSLDQSGDANYGGVAPGDWIDLKPLRTEGKSYSNFAFAIPVGAGIRYKLDRYFDISFEVSYHQTFTDYIDDVSGFYQDLDKFGEGPEANLARIMSYRANELQNVVAGEDRDFDAINAVTSPSSYYNNLPVSEYNGPEGATSYFNYRGHGEESRDAIRGKPDNDVYLVANITVSYIIGTSVRNAKFR